tara:strand:- start:768 stop:974 length:207 start_codon:yes stop_codon:yes gene_type:complete
MKQFMEYQHPDLKLRMSLYNFYLKKFANNRDKYEIARFCSKYDFDKVMEARSTRPSTRPQRLPGKNLK